MTLKVRLSVIQRTGVFDYSITHNLASMAEVAGLYYYLWKPDEIGISVAKELIKPLEAGLDLLETHPHIFQQYDSNNGLGVYEDLVQFVRSYLDACRQYPDADISFPYGEEL